MSMPEFPKFDPDLTQNQALNMILSSIALEELALSHIINAEGEKIQYILSKHCNSNCSPPSTADILAVNKSVTSLLEMVMQNQLLLKNKMDNVLEYLPKPHKNCMQCCQQYEQSSSCSNSICPTSPPMIRTNCFQVISGCYQCNTPFLWKENLECQCISVIDPECQKINLPRTGTFLFEFALDFTPLTSIEDIVSAELIVDCQNEKSSINKNFYMVSHCCKKIFTGSAVIQMPCSCLPCAASLILRSPACLQINQGYLSIQEV